MKESLVEKASCSPLYDRPDLKRHPLLFARFDEPHPAVLAERLQRRSSWDAQHLQPAEDSLRVKQAGCDGSCDLSQVVVELDDEVGEEGCRTGEREWKGVEDGREVAAEVAV